MKRTTANVWTVVAGMATALSTSIVAGGLDVLGGTIACGVLGIKNPVLRAIIMVPSGSFIGGVVCEKAFDVATEKIEDVLDPYVDKED